MTINVVLRDNDNRNNLGRRFNMSSNINDIHAFEVFDSRGNPTLCVHVMTQGGAVGVAYVPSGASTGEREALELRDGDADRFFGKGVSKAVDSIKQQIRPLLLGRSVYDQKTLDRMMLELDGTDNKSKLGANSILGVSMAIARAGAICQGIPLYRYLGGIKGMQLPCPMINILNGGAHAENRLDIQEFMIRPYGFDTFTEAMRCGVEVFHSLKSILSKNGHITAVGDEGGFAPNLNSSAEAIEVLIQAIKLAGYSTENQVSIALDVAASELYSADSKKYSIDGRELDSSEMVNYLADLTEKYPIDSIEDGLDQNDWEGWALLNKRIGSYVQVVGDDLLVTNPLYIQQAIEKESANAVLIKLNQIGSLTETLAAVELAKRYGLGVVISHRSGETEDTFIADLSVALNTGQIKTGAVSRSERVAKYNRLLTIEHEANHQFVYLDGNKQARG